MTPWLLYNVYRTESNIVTQNLILSFHWARPQFINAFSLISLIFTLVCVLVCYFVFIILSSHIAMKISHISFNYSYMFLLTEILLQKILLTGGDLNPNECGRLYKIEMATGRAARGPGRAGPGRAGPENPGPRASRTQTGLKIFYLKVLCATENSNFC